MDKTTAIKKLNKLFESESKIDNNYIARLNLYEKDTKTKVPEEFKKWVTKLGFTEANKFLTKAKIKGTNIILEGIDDCVKFKYGWTSNDFRDIKLPFIFSHELFSGDALYIDKKGIVYFCQHDPEKHTPISKSFTLFLKLIEIKK